MTTKAPKLIEQEQVNAVEPGLEGGVAVSLPAVLLLIKEARLRGVPDLEPKLERGEGEGIEESGLAVPRSTMKQSVGSSRGALTGEPCFSALDSPLLRF